MKNISTITNNTNSSTVLQLPNEGLLFGLRNIIVSMDFFLSLIALKKVEIYFYPKSEMCHQPIRIMNVCALLAHSF